MTPSFFASGSKLNRTVVKSALSLGAALMLLQPASAGTTRGFDDETIAFFNKMALNPSLLNEEYLKIMLGAPTYRQHQPGSPSHVYWHVPGFKGPKYELVTFGQAPGQVTSASFIVHKPAVDASFKDVESVFGQYPLRRFDQQSRPVEIFSFRPDTQLSFVKPQNTFQISHASIDYEGPPLPPPSVFDVMEARERRKQKVVDLHDQKQYTHSIEHLKAHLRDHPYDAESHYLMGNALRQTCALNPAVKEYCTALSLAGGNAELAENCLKALNELKVMPLSAEEMDRLHQLKLVQNEQRLRQGRLAYSSRNDASAAAAQSLPENWLQNVKEIDPPHHMFYPGTVTPIQSPAAASPGSAPVGLMPPPKGFSSGRQAAPNIDATQLPDLAPKPTQVKLGAQPTGSNAGAQPTGSMPSAQSPSSNPGAQPLQARPGRPPFESEPF